MERELDPWFAEHFDPIIALCLYPTPQIDCVVFKALTLIHCGLGLRTPPQPKSNDLSLCLNCLNEPSRHASSNLNELPDMLLNCLNCLSGSVGFGIVFHCVWLFCLNKPLFFSFFLILRMKFSNHNECY